MAISVVDTGYGLVANGNSTTAPGLTASGSDRYALAMFGGYQAQLSGATYAYGDPSAAAMAFLVNGSASPNGDGCSAYALLAPPTTANADVRATLNNTTWGALAVVVASGVDQASPVRRTGTTTGDSASMTITITCAVGDLVVAGCSWASAAPATLASGQTEVVNDVTTSQGAAAAYAIATGTSITFTWTLGGASLWGALAVVIQPAAATAASGGAMGTMRGIWGP